MDEILTITMPDMTAERLPARQAPSQGFPFWGAPPELKTGLPRRHRHAPNQLTVKHMHICQTGAQKLHTHLFKTLCNYWVPTVRCEVPAGRARTLCTSWWPPPPARHRRPRSTRCTRGPKTPWQCTSGSPPARWGPLARTPRTPAVNRSPGRHFPACAATACVSWVMSVVKTRCVHGHYYKAARAAQSRQVEQAAGNRRKPLKKAADWPWCLDCI